MTEGSAVESSFTRELETDKKHDVVVPGVVAEWSAKKARVGDKVELRAKCGRHVAEGTAAKFTIYEQDKAGGDDLVRALEGKVAGGVACASWEYEYHEDTDDVRSAQDFGKWRLPEYYFTVEVAGERARSPLLEFRSFLEIRAVDDDGRPLVNAPYVLKTADGKTRRGKTDPGGRAKEEEVPPGPYELEFPEAGNVRISDGAPRPGVRCAPGGGCGCGTALGLRPGA